MLQCSCVSLEKIGDASISDQFIQLGLTHTYVFLVQAMIGGQGKRFFESIRLNTPAPLRLGDIKKLPSGAVALYYHKTE